MSIFFEQEKQMEASQLQQQSDVGGDKSGVNTTAQSIIKDNFVLKEHQQRSINGDTSSLSNLDEISLDMLLAANNNNNNNNKSASAIDTNANVIVDAATLMPRVLNSAAGESNATGVNVSSSSSSSVSSSLSSASSPFEPTNGNINNNSNNINSYDVVITGQQILTTRNSNQDQDQEDDDDHDTDADHLHDQFNTNHKLDNDFTSFTDFNRFVLRVKACCICFEPGFHCFDLEFVDFLNNFFI
jgi:hypothetical protein